LLGTLVLLASGIGLLMTRPWGRKLAVGYAMYAVVTAILGIGIQLVFVLPGVFAQAQALPGAEANATLFGAIGGVVGGSIGLVYPGLLWFFMTRPHVLAAYGGPPLPVPEDAPWRPSAPVASTDPSNPYTPPQTSAPGAYPAGGSEAIVDTLVPSKNGPALASYYLGLFSLFPCLGFPLGVAAVYYGLKGLANVRANPEVRGGVHAWIGVICGGLFGLLNFAVACMVIIGLIGMALEQ
jgi:hypothetical protein